MGNPFEHRPLNAPVMVTVSGTIERTAAPLVFSTMVKLPTSCCPDATSVTLNCANWVGALALTRRTTLALPAESVSTVNVEASGCAGLLVTIE